MKSLTLACILAPIIALNASASETATLTSESLNPILGKDWSGSLTYQIYQPPFEDVTIEAGLEVTKVEGGFEFAYHYPNEPHANSASVVTIGENGSEIMDQPIVSNQISDDGTQTIITAFTCEDMGRAASCEVIYSLSQQAFSMRKMVTYDGETEAFRRNEYTFTR